MPRTIVAPAQAGEELAPGVVRKRIQGGGRRGPNDEVLAEVMGGQVWSEMFMFGGDADGPPICVPDIRLPANQYWPLHYHDCWIAVIVLDGSCLIGDWHMEVGDVLITASKIEYGPLLIGPSGCQMFEVFARLHPDEGGYAPEYWDHPTLDGTTRQFAERSAINQRNAGRQTLPLGGVEGLIKGHLTGGAQWDLGETGDPERAVMRSTFLGADERVAPHRYNDWHSIFVLSGDLTLDGRPLPTNDVLVIAPNSPVGELVAGSGGAKLLEVSRIAAGMDRQPPS